MNSKIRGSLIKIWKSGWIPLGDNHSSNSRSRCPWSWNPPSIRCGSSYYLLIESFQHRSIKTPSQQNLLVNNGNYSLPLIYQLFYLELTGNKNTIQLKVITNFNLKWINSWWQCQKYMVPNTALLLELNPTQRNSSKLGVNFKCFWDSYKFTDTTQKSAPLSMKAI